MKKKITLLLLLCLVLLPTLSYAKVYTTKVYTTGTHTHVMPKEYADLDPNLSQTLDWGFQYTNIQSLWKQGYSAKNNIKIGIVDTGIDVSHPDLRVYGGASFVSYTKSYDDDFGHGTHVAGIVAAKDNTIGVKGVAYNAKLYAVKVMGADGSGEVADLIKGIRWCIDNNMNIINLSLGISDDEKKRPTFKQLEAIINEAWSKNIIIVASAGNDGIGKISYPAAFPNVIAVSSISQYLYPQTGRLGLLIADYSNFGPKIEVSAPGSFVYSTYPMKLESFWSSYPGYEVLSGTSMAAPYVTGFVALLKEKYKGKNNIYIRSMLQTHVRDIGAKGKDSYYGYGMIYAK